MASLGAGPAQHIHTLNDPNSCRSEQAAAFAIIGSGTHGIDHKHTCHNALHMPGMNLKEVGPLHK